MATRTPQLWPREFPNWWPVMVTSVDRSPLNGQVVEVRPGSLRAAQGVSAARLRPIRSG